MDCAKTNIEGQIVKESVEEERTYDAIGLLRRANLESAPRNEA